MTFLNPILAIAGLACVAVPILIHILMRRRRRPVQWGAMRFLLEAYRQQRRRLKFEQLLLLASRCLVVALVALAIGRPILGRAGLLGGRGSVTLYLLVDNGLASSAVTGDGAAGTSALERHKAAAQSLISQLDAAAGDRAALVALGGPARAVVSPPSSNVAAVADLVRDLGATDSPTDIAGGLAFVRDALASQAGDRGGGGRSVVVVLSDFLSGSADTERKLAALGGRSDVVLMASTPAAAGPGNISVAALEPLRPIILASGQAGPPPQTPVRVLLRRTGSAASEATITTVRLTYLKESAGGLSAPVAAGQAVVRWAPGQTEATATAVAELTGAARAGGAGVLAASIDADAIAGDNTWRRPVEVRRTLKVGLVAPRRLGARPPIQQYEPADWVRIALEPSDAQGEESQIELVEIEPASLDAPRLAGLDAAIITAPDAIPEGAWRRVRGFADAGGLVFISPPAKATVEVWADPAMRDLGLPWSIAREAHVWTEGTTVSPDRPAATGAADLLALLAPELAELSRPVRVFKSLVVDRGSGRGAQGTLLSLADGAPLLLAAPPGSREQAAEAGPTQRGLVVLLSVALSFEWSDLQARSLMLPLMQEIVREGVGQARGTWSALAGMTPPAPPRSLELRATDPDTPPQSAKIAGDRAAEPFRRAGVWRAMDDSGVPRGLVAVNADPSGARCEAQPPSAIAAWLSQAVGGAEVRWLEPNARVEGAQGPGALRSILQRGEDGTRFAVPLLLGALLIAMFELALARWFSHAIIRPGSQEPAA